MSKKKLIHFRENLTFPFLFQYRYHEIRDEFPLRGSWNENFFRNSNPVILELGCGKGEYTVGLAKENPDRNYIGIDVKGARLWRGCKTVQEEDLRNVAFIRSLVNNAEFFFGKSEVSGVWITFPDPQPGKERKRLTSPRFMNMYRNILKEAGLVHLKTDDLDYFNYTLKVISDYNIIPIIATTDLYNSGTTEDVMKVKTYYESKWLEVGKKICYLKFSFNKPENV
ncbi:MAG: tRNA (guanosine(46)-N7)-methyltransferase TrmB [Bacteroidota bacterium]